MKFRWINIDGFLHLVLFDKATDQYYDAFTNKKIICSKIESLSSSIHRTKTNYKLKNTAIKISQKSLNFTKKVGSIAVPIVTVGFIQNAINEYSAQNTRPTDHTTLSLRPAHHRSFNYYTSIQEEYQDEINSTPILMNMQELNLSEDIDFEKNDIIVNPELKINKIIDQLAISKDNNCKDSLVVENEEKLNVSKSKINIKLPSGTIIRISNRDN